MRIGSIFLAIAGIGIAGGSVWLTDNMLASKGRAAVPAAVQTNVIEKPNIVKVWVAKTDLVFGQAITADILKT